MKRLMIGIWTVLLILFGMVIVSELTNNKLIENFKQGIYEHNAFGFLGFFEPYVNHYNRGCIYYAIGDYPDAQKEFERAMESDIADPDECRLRVNLALSLVKQLDLSDVNEDNLQDILDVLDQARDILCEDGCANRDDNNGHWPDAQTLKNEIDELYNQLTTPPEEQDPDNDPDASPTPTPTPTPTPSPTPEGGEDTPTPTEDPSGPTPTPDGEEGGPTPTPEENGNGDPETPTPEGGQQGATPTPTQTPEEQLMDIQNQAQQERYAGANGTPSDEYNWNMGDWASW